MLFADGSTTIFISLYFRFISRNWIGFQVCGFVLTCLSTLGLFFVPESPKYLWSAKKYKEARDKLNYIAKFNMNTNYNKKFKFETEISEDLKDRKKISISFNSNSNSKEVQNLLAKINTTTYDDTKTSQVDTMV